AHISYYNLTRLAEIKIDWVDSIGEHLEFDRKQRALKLFRFPSFCALLCRGDPEKTFLCRDLMFAPSAENGYLTLPIPSSGTFLREIMSTYRLFFGQDKPSRRVFRKDFDRMSADDQCKLRSDPLLLHLCQEDWSKQMVYEELDIPNVRSVYSASIDFPFFMARLVNLQEYVITQQPTGWTSLWRDRRDPARFWGLFAVILFGVVSIVLALVQIGLGGAQVA
ncbi:uncharacterized protein BDR25DRAFT_201402, partial [Lindgomyces ingoldianus]